MNELKFKDLKIGVFVLFNEEYAVKINKSQILTSHSTIIEPDENDTLIVEGDFEALQ